MVARLRIGIGVPREPAGVFVLLELFTIKFKTEWMDGEWEHREGYLSNCTAFFIIN